MNPAAARTAWAAWGSAWAKGPGAPAGGAGRSRPAASAPPSSRIHSLACGPCHTSRASRPPDFYLLVGQWARWAASVVETWPDDPRQAKHDPQVIAETVRRAAEGAKPPGG